METDATESHPYQPERITVHIGVRLFALCMLKAAIEDCQGRVGTDHRDKRREYAASGLRWLRRRDHQPAGADGCFFVLGISREYFFEHGLACLSHSALRQWREWRRTRATNLRNRRRPMIAKKCPSCGRSFEVRNIVNQHRYCSRSCVQVAAMKRRMLQGKASTSWHRVCPSCKLPFTATRALQTFCGSACSRRAFGQRARARALIPIARPMPAETDELAVV